MVGRTRAGRAWARCVPRSPRFPVHLGMLTFTIAAVLALAHQWPVPIESSQVIAPKAPVRAREDVSGESWCSQSPTNLLDSLLSKNRHQHLPRRPHGQSDRMPSRESLILGQRQTSEALASPRLDHHMSKRERTRANGAPYPAQPSDQRDWDRLRHHDLGVPPVIQGVRPSFHPDQRLVFQSRSDRWAVVAVRNGSFVRRRKSKAMLTYGRYVAYCLRGPILHARACQPGHQQQPRSNVVTQRGRGRLLAWPGDVLMHWTPWSFPTTAAPESQAS